MGAPADPWQGSIGPTPPRAFRHHEETARYNDPDPGIAALHAKALHLKFTPHPQPP